MEKKDMEKVLVKSHSITFELCELEPKVSNGINNIKLAGLFCRVKEVAWKCQRKYSDDGKTVFWITPLSE